jgi:glycosyltransferase involved in cell wall biosynthesis
MDKYPCVLHLSSLPLSRGGIESFLVSITNGMSKHYDIVVASGENESFREKIYKAGGRSALWEVKSILDIRAYFRLLELIKQERPALVHIHDARAGWIGRLVLAVKHIPVIITVHLPSYYYRRERFPYLWRKFYKLVETILNYTVTTRVVYPSKSGYQYALREKIVAVHNSACIPNGINTIHFSVSNNEIDAFRAEMDVDRGQTVICTLGRLSIEKNISLVISAFTQIKAQYFPVYLWIVGDGPERINLEEQVRTSGVGEYIRFVSGNLNMALPLAACDVFVLASWYEGGRTLSVMEAQVSGKPCVVSKVGDLPQMVENGVYGFVFPEGNINACTKALEKLLADDSLRKKMGQAARRMALTEYGVEKMLAEYGNLYQTVLALEKAL